MSLVEYKRKRHFKRTPEPAGKQARARKGKALSYLIQKHDASHLHYDFRLELDGVLKSWAVPKGPSLDPKVKRLAVEVEDHPLEYGKFEGTIPEGEYGGGTVMLWDRGTWEPVDDPHDGYRRGRLKFALQGEKLQGEWMLVRSHSTKYGNGKKPQWLLMKIDDDEARPEEEGDVLEELPLSVKTGRDLAEIAGHKHAAKKHTSPTRKHTSPKRKRGRTAKKSDAQSVKGQEADASRSPTAVPLPKKIDVQLATLVDEAPAGDEWLHEIKFDGYRMICRIENGKAQFLSRNHQDWTGKLTSLATAMKQLPIENAILDGEVVALRPDGSTDFQELQNAFREQRAAGLVYYAFDLLHLEGRDVARLPLEHRKKALAVLISSLPKNARIRYSEHLEGDGPAFLKQVCRMKLEGIISKRRDKPYQSGRGQDWLKAKCVNTEEFVIGGYTEPAGARVGFGALHVGYYDRQGQFLYAGKVGTGFDAAGLKSLTAKLEKLEQKNSPFENFKKAGGKTHWVQPLLVGQFVFGSWTREGLLRHASFQGLREDKPAKEVARDSAVSVAEVKKPSAEEKPMKATRVKKSTASAQTQATAARHSRKSKTPPSDNELSQDYDVREQEFDGVRLTSPNKVLYPEQGITKLDLAGYYRAVAEWILPHLEDRPLVLVRCPEGREGQCFYQKHPVQGTPDTLRQIPIKEKEKTENYVIVDDVAGLISLAQIGALEIHAWGSRADKLEQPDRLIFDLDPDPSVAWPRVVGAAQQVREFLQELGLESFVKTTGGKGLHVVVPIDRRHDWDEAKQFCKDVADAIVAADSASFTANMSKAARGGKIFLDYLRNGRGATAVVPYSTRARENAPVSMPLAWEELTPQIHSDAFHIGNALERLEKLKDDPWSKLAKTRQSLTKPIQILSKLI